MLSKQDCKFKDPLVGMWQSKFALKSIWMIMAHKFCYSERKHFLWPAQFISWQTDSKLILQLLFILWMLFWLPLIFFSYDTIMLTSFLVTSHSLQSPASASYEHAWTVHELVCGTIWIITNNWWYAFHKVLHFDLVMHFFRYNGWSDALRTIWRTEGLKGMFKGSIPRVIWYIPASALTFMAVEFLRDHFNEKMDDNVHEVTGLSLDTKSKIQEPV